MEFRVTNGSAGPLTGLRVQMCVMLAGLAGFEGRTNDNKVFAAPFAACKDETGRRWVVTGWERCARAWGNPPCPCMHADPVVEDCLPGKTKSVRGWLSFYKGTDIDAELKRLKEIARTGFYVTAYYILVCMIHFARNDLDAVEQLLREARNQAEENNLKAVEAHLLARRGRIDEARRLLRELSSAPYLGAGAAEILVSTAVLAGEPELAALFARVGILEDLVPTMARIEPALHPLLDQPAFGPRKWDAVLVWPLEAPMMHPSVLPLFREVRIESGLPQMSEVRSSAP